MFLPPPPDINKSGSSNLKCSWRVWTDLWVSRLMEIILCTILTKYNVMKECLIKECIFLVSNNRIKYLGITLIPTVESLYEANYILLLNQISDGLNWKHLLINWLGRINVKYDSTPLSMLLLFHCFEWFEFIIFLKNKISEMVKVFIWQRKRLPGLLFQIQKIFATGQMLLDHYLFGVKSWTLWSQWQNSSWNQWVHPWCLLSNELDLNRTCIKSLKYFKFVFW